MRSQAAHAEGMLTAAVGKAGRRDAVLGWTTALLSIITAVLATGGTPAPGWLAVGIAFVTAVAALVTSYRSEQRNDRIPKLTAALSGFSGLGIDAANRLDMWNLELSRNTLDMAKALEELAALRKRMGDLMNNNATLYVQLKAPPPTQAGSGTGLVMPTRGASESGNDRVYIYYPDDDEIYQGYDEKTIEDALKPSQSRASSNKKKPITIRRIE